MATSSLEDILATRVRRDFLYRVNFKKILENNIPLMEDWCEKTVEINGENQSISSVIGSSKAKLMLQCLHCVGVLMMVFI